MWELLLPLVALVSMSKSGEVDPSETVKELQKMEVRVFIWTVDSPHKLVDIPLTSILANVTSDPILKNLGLHNQVKFLIHGFSDMGQTHWIMNIKDRYLEKTPTNISAVISIDWSKVAGKSFVDYVFAAYGTRKVGLNVGRWIEGFMQANNLTADQVHIIGFSLGSHVAGFAGEAMKNKVARITGLDPAAPLFGRFHRRLSKDSAKFVDVIHTTGFFMTILEPMGHVDFYPNGGQKHQPGCENDTTLDFKCSHYRAFRLFDQTIANPESFVARRCPSYESFLRNQCGSLSDGDLAVMGENVSHNASGSYYLLTGPSPPYFLALTQPGLDNATFASKTKDVMTKAVDKIGGIIG